MFRLKLCQAHECQPIDVMNTAQQNDDILI